MGAARGGSAVCLTAIALTAALASGCYSTRIRRAGPDNLWREAGVRFEVGVTQEADVLAALGPPAQIVPLERWTVFFYQTEETDTEVIIVTMLNTRETMSRFDRAIFFFDPNGVLADYALSHGPLDHERSPPGS